MEIWDISQMTEVVMLSHIDVATVSSIPEFQHRNGGSRRINDCLQPYLKVFAEKF